MLAHKCDLCGTYYFKPTPVCIWEKSASPELFDKRIEVVLRLAKGGDIIDLCESCAKELEEWINAKREWTKNDSDCRD